MAKKSRKIEEINLDEIEWTDWVDPRIPSWWGDPAVHRYFRRRYGLNLGGIIDDDDELPPLLVIEKIH